MTLYLNTVIQTKKYFQACIHPHLHTSIEYLQKAHTHAHTKNFQIYRTQYIHPFITSPSFLSFPYSIKKSKNPIILTPYKCPNLPSYPTLATDGLGWEYGHPSIQIITSLLCVYLHTFKCINCQFRMCKLISIRRAL
jgi:hypothetical protein